MSMERVRHYLILASLPALGAAIILIAIRALTAPFWDSAAPALRLAFLCLIGGLIAASLVGANLAPPGKARQLAIWGGIFSLIAATPILSNDWMTSAQRFLEGDLDWVQAGDPPASAAECGAASPSRVELERRRNGHYYVDAYLTHTAVYTERGGTGEWRAAERCRAVNFLVDTGATGVLLVADDARALGVDLAGLDYFIPVRTASDTILAAPIIIRELNPGGNLFRNVPALVHEGGQSLLGMEVLDQFASMQISNDRLILTP